MSAREKKVFDLTPPRPKKRILTRSERMEYERLREELRRRLEPVGKACVESETFTAKDMMTTITCRGGA